MTYNFIRWRRACVSPLQYLITHLCCHHRAEHSSHGLPTPTTSLSQASGLNIKSEQSKIDLSELVVIRFQVKELVEVDIVRFKVI